MSKYKEIKGFKVQTLASDTAVSQAATGTWASGGTMNTDRWGNAGAGIQTSGLSINGQNPDSTNIVEEYNGTSWTEIAETNNSRSFGVGVGANAEAVLHFTGWGPPTTATNELWNGSAWTETTDLNTARYKACGAGITTAAICIAGTSSSPPDSNRLTVVEVWDGSSWTEVAEVNTGGGDAASAGTSTDSIKAGTSNGPGTQVETWDGSSWTETTELNTGRYYVRGSGPSGLTDTLVFGGQTPGGAQAITEKWDGSSWTEVADMATARGAAASTNTTSTSAWIAGGTNNGGTSGDTAVTEEFTAPSTFSKINLGQVYYNSGSNAFKVTAQSIPAGTWSSGGSVNTAREGGCGFGSLTAGVAAGGFDPSPSAVSVEHYNGSSWTAQSNIPQTTIRGGATGTQTAGIIYGMGHAPSGGSRGDSFSYDGTNWTAIAELNDPRNNGASSGGLQTSALYAGGTPPTTQSVEIWNGTSWTEVNDLNQSRYSCVGGGTTTSAVVAGGYGGSPTTNPSQSETWNGTSWTETSELNTGRAFLTGGGNDSTQVILFGGGPAPGTYNKTEFWNGSSWTELNDMTSPSETSFGTTQGAGLNTYRASGRISGAVSAVTEEWTAPAANQTITVS